MPSQTLRLIKSFFFCICIGFFNTAIALESWQILKPGIAYLDLNQNVMTPWSHIHVFKIDLQRYQFNAVLAEDLDETQAFIEDYAKFKDSLIALNGGFFDQKHHPLGLRINNKIKRSRMKNISWWGIFYIENNRAHVVSSKQFRETPDIQFAVQSGPRLLIDGEIPRLKTGKAKRTALGITYQGDVIIVVTENTVLTSQELAFLMQSPPLNCNQAINLDGGSSTQLAAILPSFNLKVPGFSKISDAITITEKN